jgi:hypothetical protein
MVNHCRASRGSRVCGAKRKELLYEQKKERLNMNKKKRTREYGARMRCAEVSWGGGKFNGVAGKAEAGLVGARA